MGYVNGHDQYVVKVDGSGRLTNRNRKFLRPLLSFKDDLKEKNDQEVEVEPLLRRSGRLAEMEDVAGVQMMTF